jgi:hypothetical protein
MLIIIAVALSASTIALSLIVSSIAATYGFDVAQRFLERGKTIPSTNEELSPDSLEKWLHSSTFNNIQAKKYTCIVIPSDILFLLLFSGFLLLASISLRQFIPFFNKSILAACAVLVFPICYAVADFVEDSLIIYLLRRPKPVEQVPFQAMRAATTVKMIAASAALIQVALLAGCAIWFHPFLSDCSYAGLLPHCSDTGVQDPSSVAVPLK